MKYIKLFIIPLALLLILSCGRDEDLGPIITVDNAQIGAFPRLVTLITGEYDLANIPTSTYSHEVEFQSEDAGNNVESYDIWVGFNDGDQVLYRSFGQGDFGSSAVGLRNITVSIGFTEIADFLGIDVNSIVPGDQFQFNSFLNLSDGRSFNGSAASTESTIFNNAFRGYFDWNVNATCPVPDEAFAGLYVISFDGDPSGLGYGTPYVAGDTVEISPVTGSSTRRTFPTSWLGFDSSTGFDLVCEVVVFEGFDLGAGCGDGTIQFGPIVDGNGDQVNPLVDLTDDSSFNLLFNQGFNSGGCGNVMGSTMTNMILTRI